MAHWPNEEKSPKGPHAVNHLPSDPRTPMVVDADADGFFALLESDLYSASAFGAIQFTPVVGSPSVTATSQSAVLAAGDFVSPWRVVLVGDTPGDLLESTVAVNSAAPLALDDASWVTPGKALFNWRTLGYQTDDGFTYRIDTPTLKRLIDFAAANGIEYVKVDDNWFQLIQNGRLLLQASGFDIDDVIEFAESKGVRIVIYVDRNPERRIIKTTDEQIFELYDGLGGSATSTVSGVTTLRLLAPLCGARRKSGC